jgi:hypothetical protein
MLGADAVAIEDQASLIAYDGSDRHSDALAGA